jgi:glucose-6-phosphate 1-dehydrogenase
VIGASGDLAKKKIYPSLLHLYDCNLLPDNTVIWGYARSSLDHSSLRTQIKPYLEKAGHYPPSIIDQFLSICFYQQGNGYGDVDAVRSLASKLDDYATKTTKTTLIEHSCNRLFYLAIPPNVFAETGLALKSSGAMASSHGWSRLIVEKPFGRDLQSCEELLQLLAKTFVEEQLYRIDHYLGKEMVQNLLVLRFSNLLFERIWDHNHIQCVMLTFKEPFGTEGRGGYFDEYGIIR